MFVNGHFVDPNNNFYNCVRQEISKRSKQEKIHSDETATPQNDIGNNEQSSKDESIQNQNTNEKFENLEITLTNLREEISENILLEENDM